MAVEQVSNPTEPLNVPEPAMPSQVFYYSPWRFLRVAFAIAWSAFTHPFSSTVINLETGEVHHQSREERE